MASQDPNHVPPLRFHALTGIYDRVLAATTRERYFKKALLARVSLPQCAVLLDLGCGTGTMTRWLRDDWPSARIIGLDADAQALAIAERKKSREDHLIEFRLGDARALPLEDASIDLVVSSLFFHHLNDPGKVQVLGEAFRVTRPGGALLVADWGKPQSIGTALGFLLVRCLDGFSRTRANAAGELPTMIEQAGFSKVSKFDRIRTMFGEIQLLQAVRKKNVKE